MRGSGRCAGIHRKLQGREFHPSGIVISVHKFLFTESILHL